MVTVQLCTEVSEDKDTAILAGSGERSSQVGVKLSVGILTAHQSGCMHTDNVKGIPINYVCGVGTFRHSLRLLSYKLVGNCKTRA